MLTCRPVRSASSVGHRSLRFLSHGEHRLDSRKRHSSLQAIRFIIQATFTTSPPCDQSIHTNACMRNLIAVLKACASSRDLDYGRLVHANAMNCTCMSNVFVTNTLVDMYAKCGSLGEARAVFDTLGTKNVVTWNVMITGYVQHGLSQNALDLYKRMQSDGVAPDSVTFLGVLRACAKARSLQVGKEIHEQISKLGLQEDVVLSNTLLHMYARCGRSEHARMVFDRVLRKDVVTWNAMMEGYIQNGYFQKALSLYDTMLLNGVTTDEITFACVLKACGKMGAIDKGKSVHIEILERGLEACRLLGNALVDMYVKCGGLKNALQLFNRLPTKDVVTWNSLIAGYVHCGHSADALGLYAGMRREGVTCASTVTFICLLKACANVGALHNGKQLHAQILERGMEADERVGNALAHMYVTCGSIEDAHRLLDRLPLKDVVTWNVMMQGSFQCGLFEEAFNLYERMRQNGILPTRVTFMCMLRACAKMEAIEKGREIHTHILEYGMEEDSFVMNTLVAMYAKLGALKDARTLFDRLSTRDVVTWNAMIEGYAQHGLGEEALNVYNTMWLDGLVPDKVTFIASLKACASLGILQRARELHAQISAVGQELDEFVGNSLVDMYANCGSLEDACTVFDRLAVKTTVTWNAMIEAYVQNGRGLEALKTYERMLKTEVLPDKVTYLSTLKACGCTGALQLGKSLHGHLVDRGLEDDVSLRSALVDMYAKSGDLAAAWTLVNRLAISDVVTWTALINGYGKQNNARMAIQCFEDMLRHGVQPNCATFTCLLVACSHGSLVDEGQRYFNLMVEGYGIHPTLELSNCVVDLLARSGRLDAAEYMLRATTPFEPNVAGWISILSASRKHGDVDRGKMCFDHLISIEPKLASAYVLMRSIYEDSGRWKDLDNIQRLGKLAGVQKKPAVAYIEVNNKVREFVVGQGRPDTSVKLRSLDSHVTTEGHLQQADLVLRQSSDKEKGTALCGHAEKLALAYGLLNTPEGTRLLVTKSLRMCTNCHTGTKLLSKIEQRLIVVRDAHRVHRFRDGLCSCETAENCIQEPIGIMIQ